MKKLSIILLTVLFLIGCQSGPQLSPEELEEKWRAPIIVAALNAGICETATETAQKVNNGDVDGLTAFGEVMGVSLMIRLVDDSLAEAAPTTDQTELLSQMQADVDALKAVLGPWIDDEITSADVLAQIDDVCTDTTRTLEQTLEAAADDGLTDEAVETMANDLANALEEVSGEFE